ncbi:hypothetical protein FJTKL_14723 [Diaporthe vaccinii]|uniref:Uncharacterized protein n=1 Tax=Diaporthe vaccinii TaxID=105482 RepID=A0ABR4F7P3_9PEZI
MAARLLSSGACALRSAGAVTRRSFQTTTPRLYADAAPLPASKPLGAFRGGLFGFLVGATLAGSGTYYYVLQDYKASNELLQDDIYVRFLIPILIPSHTQTSHRIRHTHPSFCTTLVACLADPGGPNSEHDC